MGAIPRLLLFFCCIAIFFSANKSNAQTTKNVDSIAKLLSVPPAYVENILKHPPEEAEVILKMLSDSTVRLLLKKQDSAAMRQSDESATTVYFNFTESELKPNEKSELDKLRKQMQPYLDLKIKFIGHSAGDKISPYNQMALVEKAIASGKLASENKANLEAAQEASQPTFEIINQKTGDRKQETESPAHPSPFTPHQFYIIAGSFIFPDNAEHLKGKLVAKGYPASVIGKNAKGNTLIAYSGFDTKVEAEKELQKIRIKEDKTAWLIPSSSVVKENIVKKEAQAQISIPRKSKPVAPTTGISEEDLSSEWQYNNKTGNWETKPNNTIKKTGYGIQNTEAVTQINTNSTASSLTPALTTHEFHIIAGCFRIIENAENLLKTLTSEGFPAKIIGKSAGGLTMVSYNSFANRTEAIKELQKIKKKNDKAAWLFVK